MLAILAIVASVNIKKAGVNMSNYRILTVVSRPKDNRDVENFKTTSRGELINLNHFENNNEVLDYAVDHYRYLAKPGETFRVYMSVNKRSFSKTHNKLIHELIDGNVNLTTIQSKVASIAAKPENAEEHQWLFDVDYDEDILNNQFIPDLLEASGFTESDLDIYQTKSHYGVIVPHGFNTIDLLANYPEVELKRDDLRYVGSFTRNAES